MYTQEILEIMAQFSNPHLVFCMPGGPGVGSRALRERLNELNHSAQVIQDEADIQNRSLTTAEERDLQAIFDEFKDVELRLRIADQRDNLDRSQGRLADGIDPGAVNAGGRFADPPVGGQYRGGRQSEVWAGPTPRASFALAVKEACAQGGRVHPGLVMNAPSTFSSEGVGADGGFAVPPDFQNEIWQKVAGEDSIVARTDEHTTTKNTMVWPADETTPWDTTGGIQAYWESEAAQLTASKVALKNKTIRLNKLTVLIPVTEELLEDAPSLDSYLRKKCFEKFDFKITLKLIAGTGVGEPMGILNSPSLVTVPKVSGQVASTIMSANIEAMWAAMYAPCRRNAIWLINQDIEPQLAGLYIPIPTTLGGSTYAGGWPLYYPQGSIAGTPYATLKGRPIVETQACSMLGTPGDIILVDLKQYLTAAKTGGIKTDVSMHLYFDYDLYVYRMILRFAGQPWWEKVITPLNDATNLLSWATCIALRA
jgi:HK97 family phage major capsid protein